MGIYARTTMDIKTKNLPAAKKVKAVLDAMAERSDEHGNFAFEQISCHHHSVFIDHSSNRVQNLEWQVEEVWDKVKKIPGVLSLNAPLLQECDGLYFEND